MASPRPSRTKHARLTRRIVMAICLAVLTEAAIIAATLYRVPFRVFGWRTMYGSGTVVQADDLYWVVDINRMPGETRLRADANAERDRAMRSVEGIYAAIKLMTDHPAPAKIVAEPPRPPPSWSTFSSHDPRPYRSTLRSHHFSYFLEEIAVGWPWRCVRGWTVRAGQWPPLDAQGRSTGTPNLQTTTRGLLDFHDQAYPLPYLPIWFGLLSNVVVLAMPWYLLLWLGAAARRTHRRRQHRCPSCGYDRTGVTGPCPECGGQS